MKLRNKKTGEIVDINIKTIEYSNNPQCYPKHRIYTSIAELNEEWEDYEEPKDFYYIQPDGFIHWVQCHVSGYELRKFQVIGNYFETEEEAEKAVEKLKAWKRLKDKGFKFYDWKDEATYRVAFDWNEDIKVQEVQDDLDLLFGGEDVTL